MCYSIEKQRRGTHLTIKEIRTMYEVIKVNCENGNETNYGTYTSKEDVKAIVKGYKFNGLFYTRENSKYFFMVTEK